MIRRKPRIKYLTAKQAEVALMLQAREVIPPWWQATNDNTRRDLRAYNGERMLDQIDKALKVENCPAEALKEIRIQVKTFVLGMDRVRNANKRETKNRDKLETLFRTIEMMINNLNNATGFDLYDSSTWGDPSEGHAERSNK
jgi:hypothetical protein